MGGDWGGMGVCVCVFFWVTQTKHWKNLGSALTIPGFHQFDSSALVSLKHPNLGYCWETFCIFACCGFVGNPHLTAKIYFFAPLSTSTK